MSARLKLTVASPPQTFTEPLSASELADWLNIPAADQTQSMLVDALITAAREVAELRQGRDLVEKQYDLTMDCIPACIETRDNLTTVDSFEYRDSDGTWHTLTEGADYIVDTAQNLILPPYGGSWPSFTPWPSSAVLVRYTVTPPQVDSQVLMGMKFLVSMWYVNRIPLTEQASSVQNYPYCLGLLDHGKVERV